MALLARTLPSSLRRCRNYAPCGRVAPHASRAGRQSRNCSSEPQSEAPEEFITRTLLENNVAIFSKTYCGFSGRVKRIMEDMGAPYKAIELDQRSDGLAIQDALFDLTQQRTVPNVFIRGEHIGGWEGNNAPSRFCS